MEEEKNKKILRKEVKRRAVDKIKMNIYYIYENLNAKKEIENIKIKFGIPDDFYNRYVTSMPLFSPKEALRILLFDCISVWNHEFSKSEKWQNRIIRNIGMKKYNSFLNSASIKKRKEKTKANFILNTFVFYFNNDDTIDLHNPMRINPKIWGQIICAKIFEIPQKNIIDKLKNLTNIYFPAIDENMRIQINELTGIEDIKFVWKQIENRQKKYSKYHNLIQNKKYHNHDRDKLAYELRVIQLKSRKEIKKLLDAEGFYTGLRVSYITRMVKSYKNFIGEV